MVSTNGVYATSFETNQNTETESNVLMSDGNLVTVQINSPGLENNVFGDDALRNVKVYLPPGYSSKKECNYPVIYLLPWENTLYNCWFRNYNGLSLTELLDNAIRSGKINPVIVVSPDARNSIGGSWYTNSELIGKWEDFVVKDVVNFIDNNFRTLPYANCRGIAGSSMGGYGALKLATKHPDVFSAVYAQNAMVDFETLINDTVIWENSFNVAANSSSFRTEDELANQLLQMATAFAPDENNPPLYGTLPKASDGSLNTKVVNKWLKNDPMQMIPDYRNNLLQLKAISIDCSAADAQIMLSSNYSEALNSNGIQHNFNHFYGKDNKSRIQRFRENGLSLFSDKLENSLLNVNSYYCYTPEDNIKSWLITDGTIYIVPYETKIDLNSVLKDKLLQVETTAFEKNDIPLDELKKGVYKLVGVSNDGFVGEPVLFGANESKNPKVSICVTCSKTGKNLDFCQILIDGEECETKSTSQHIFQGAGTHEIQIDNEDYYTLKKSVTIYTDTTLNYSMVKDSYLQVVEKGVGNPVFEATVTQNNRATLTSLDGYTVVQNLRNGILDCRIFKSGYHTEVVHKQLEPGYSTVVELTPKKAEVCFNLFDENGTKIPEVYVKLDDKHSVANEHGEVCFSDLDTRKEYTYSITDGRFEYTENTFVLESKMTISVQLLSVNNASAMTNEFSEVLPGNRSQHLSTGLNNFSEKHISVYPNPAKKAINVQSGKFPIRSVEIKDLQGRTIYCNKPAKNSHRIDLTSFKPGIYMLMVKTNNEVYTNKIIKK